MTSEQDVHFVATMLCTGISSLGCVLSIQRCKISNPTSILHPEHKITQVVITKEQSMRFVRIRFEGRLIVASRTSDANGLSGQADARGDDVSPLKSWCR